MSAWFSRLPDGAFAGSPPRFAAPPPAGADMAAELRGIGGAVTEPFAPAERAILAIGERLCGASDALGRLTAAFESLPLELDHEEVRETMRHLGSVAGALSAIADTLGDERAALEDLADRARIVGERAQRLHKTVAAISVLAVNARIAAAHIDAEREDFSIFTVEIARLTATASGTIDRFAHELDRLGGQLRSAGAGQAAFERAHGADLRAAAARMEACLDTVRRRRDQAAAAAMEIGTRSRRIAEGVSAAVKSLQIGDITRQRAEHVGHALEVLADALGGDRGEAGREAWCAALSEEQRAAVVSAVCRLQATQAGRAAAEFEEEIRCLTAALLALADDARAITGLGDRLYGGTKGGGASFLAELAAELGKAEALMTTCQEARAEVDKVAETAARSLAALVTEIEAVRAIEVDMRLVGLNTALKCGRLGAQGRTLSVIAQELRTYANHTVEDAQAVMAGLREVVGTAQALHRRGTEQGAARMALLGQEAAGAIGRLDAVGAGLSAALATLEGEGGRIARVLADTAAGISMQEDVGRVMHAAVQRLDALAIAGPESDEDAEVVRERVLALLKGHYTMASERDIHDLFTGADVVAGRDPPGRQAEANVDDLLF